jgi:hypothetical protein
VRQVRACVVPSGVRATAHASMRSTYCLRHAGRAAVPARARPATRALSAITIDNPHLQHRTRESLDDNPDAFFHLGLALGFILEPDYQLHAMHPPPTTHRRIYQSDRGFCGPTCAHLPAPCRSSG